MNDNHFVETQTNEELRDKIRWLPWSDVCLVSITSLHIGRRATNVLLKNGVLNIGHLLFWIAPQHDRRLHTLHGMGITSIKEIYKALSVCINAPIDLVKIKKHADLHSYDVAITHEEFRKNFISLVLESKSGKIAITEADIALLVENRFDAFRNDLAREIYALIQQRS